MEDSASKGILDISNDDIMDENFSLSDAVSAEPDQERNLTNISECKESLDNVLNTKKILNEHWECQDSDGDQLCTKQNPCQILKQKAEAHKPKIWKCKYSCGKIFTQEKYMNNHILVMHENVNLVQCKICSKYLSTKSRLKSHMLRHSGVKHLVCLVCVNKRFNELSCLRHHLLEEHQINSKHPLFNEAYYQLSLKEISIVEQTKTNTNSPSTLSLIKKRKETINLNQKSALDIEELNDKIKDKSEKFHVNLKLLVPKTKETNVNDKAKDDNNLSENTNLKEIDFLQILNSKPQKIVTAENGMKLVKLANGQFRKISSL